MKFLRKQRKAKLPSDTKLFYFTERDEVKMIMAIKSAQKYMRSYGKGSEPGYLISDYNNYK